MKRVSVTLPDGRQGQAVLEKYGAGCYLMKYRDSADDNWEINVFVHSGSRVVGKGARVYRDFILNTIKKNKKVIA